MPASLPNTGAIRLRQKLNKIRMEAMMELAIFFFGTSGYGLLSLILAVWLRSNLVSPLLW